MSSLMNISLVKWFWYDSKHNYVDYENRITEEPYFKSSTRRFTITNNIKKKQKTKHCVRL